MTRGFSLIEALIALTIIATTLIAVTMVTLGIPNVLLSTRMHQEGLLLARSGFSREMARGVDGYPFIQSISTSTRGSYGVGLGVHILGDGSAKRIESSARWNMHGSRRSVSVTGFATDYKNAANYACSPFVFGTQDSLEDTRTNMMLPPIASLTATRKYLVAVASSTPGFRDASLFVFNTNGLLNLRGSFDQASTTKTGYIDATASSDFLYALSAHTCSTGTCASLDVFSFNTAPFMRSASMPLPAARSVTYHHNHLYIGLRSSTTGPEFLIFDTTDPTQPVRVGSSEIGSTVNDIVTNGTVAYLATADNSAAGNKAVMAIHVETPRENMAAIMQSRQAGAGVSQHLYLAGRTLYLGRSSPLHSKELYLFDTEDLVHERSAQDTDSSVMGLVVRGDRAFVLTRTRLELWDSVDPTHPLQSESLELSGSMSATALACSGTRLYLAANDARGGHLVTPSNL